MSTVVDTNTTVNMMKKNVSAKLNKTVNTEGEEAEGGGEEGEVGKPVEPKRRIVIMPMFFRSHKADKDIAVGETPLTPQTPLTPHTEAKWQSAQSSRSYDDNEDMDDNDSVNHSNSASKKKSAAKRHRKDWRRWQIDVDEDSDDDVDGGGTIEEEEVEVGKMMRNKSTKVGGGLGGIRMIGGMKKKLMMKRQRRENLRDSPIDVSPLVHYLHWHIKDKRVCWDLRRTLRMAHDIIRKKAVQEEIDENQHKYKQSLSVFFEDYFFRNFGI